MSRLLSAQNPSTIGTAFTRLSSAASAAATSLTVDNNSGFAKNEFIVVGEEGKEDAEIQQISGLSDNDTLSLVGSLKFAHAIDDPVRFITCDQIKFYGATSSTIASTDLLATVDIDIDSANKETLYNHLTGTNSWYYKFTFYNSFTGDESSLDDAVTISGGTANDLYCTEEGVLDYLHLSKDDESAPSASLLLSLIQARTERINAETKSSFRTETVASDDKKYVDGRGKYRKWYFLGHAPILSITLLEITDTSPGGTATWTTLTEGRDDDYILDSDTGFVYVIKDDVYPVAFPNSLRWYGTWGRSTVPDDVRDAVIKGVILDLAKTGYYKAIIEGHQYDVSNVNLNEFQKEWDKIVNRYKVVRFINT